MKSYRILVGIFVALLSIGATNAAHASLITVDETATGTLDPDSEITVTYKFFGLLPGSDLISSSTSPAFVSAESTGGPVSNSISSPLVFAIANLGGTGGGFTTGHTTLINASGVSVDFSSQLHALFTNIGNAKLLAIRYDVASVPLPAALPMFGALLAGLFGYSRRQREHGRRLIT